MRRVSYGNFSDNFGAEAKRLSDSVTSLADTALDITAFRSIVRRMIQPERPSAITELNGYVKSYASVACEPTDNSGIVAFRKGADVGALISSNLFYIELEANMHQACRQFETEIFNIGRLTDSAQERMVQQRGMLEVAAIGGIQLLPSLGEGINTTLERIWPEPISRAKAVMGCGLAVWITAQADSIAIGQTAADIFNGDIDVNTAAWDLYDRSRNQPG